MVASAHPLGPWPSVDACCFVGGICQDSLEPVGVSALLQGQPWNRTGAWRSTDGLRVSLEDQVKVIIGLSLESLWRPCRPLPWSQSVNKSQIISPKGAISDIYHWAEGQPSQVEITPNQGTNLRCDLGRVTSLSWAAHLHSEGFALGDPGCPFQRPRLAIH